MKPEKGWNVSRRSNRFPIDTFKNYPDQDVMWTTNQDSSTRSMPIQQSCQRYLEAVRRKYHPRPDEENIGAYDKLQQNQHALHKPVHGRGLNFTSFSQAERLPSFPISSSFVHFFILLSSFSFTKKQGYNAKKEEWDELQMQTSTEVYLLRWVLAAT